MARETETCVPNRLGELRRFVSDTSGATAVLFGIALLPLALATGAAVDYSRANATRTELQKALDAALIAGAIEASKGKTAKAIPPFVKGFFQANSTVKGSVKLTTQADAIKGLVSGTAQVAVPTTFMNLAGIKNMSVSATSQALYSLGKSEIALALDTTGSMSGPKLAAAQQAANDLIDALFTMPNADEICACHWCPSLITSTSASNIATRRGLRAQPIAARPRRNAGMTIRRRSISIPKK